ncbi:FixH family protein [Methylobacillus flagellatus]|uniref:FixH family protein n=1 Tax=Methylobacillus flagellatus TaxID=405 RepID=UPI002853CE54|nr:FixH family protein [Methylobacillus flagellatus]MDR5170655.1 FixH family protein [Methylobacillus flagellatus]
MLKLIPVLSIAETLFGGLIFAIGLYFLLRAARVANFWAAVLSGAIPFLLYIVYSTQHWAGGDVLAIHFAVFLANAGLLGVFGSMKQKQQSMHWGPKIIIGFFIFLVISNAILLSIAGRGLPQGLTSFFLPNPDNQRVHTAFPGVMPHDRNKSYQPHLEQLQQQQALGWQLKLQGVDDLNPGTSKRIAARILDENGNAVTQAEVTLNFWRMANSRDDKIYALEEQAEGEYGADVVLPDSGRWIAEVLVKQGDKRYRKQESLFIGDE